MVFKEYEENYDIAIKELEKLIKTFFDEDGFPLSRNPNDLVFFFKIFYSLSTMYKWCSKIFTGVFRNYNKKKFNMSKKYFNTKWANAIF